MTLLFVLLNLHYPFPEAPLAIAGHSISVLGSEEVRSESRGSIGREREGGKERDRQTEEKQGGRKGDKGVTPEGVERSCHILTPKYQPLTMP